MTYDNTRLRQLFSLIIALFDISRGEWKDGVLSLLGIFSKDWLFVGLVGKNSGFVREKGGYSTLVKPAVFLVAVGPSTGAAILTRERFHRDGRASN